MHEPARNAHAKLKAVARTDNPYSLIAIFGRGHLAIKAGVFMRQGVHLWKWSHWIHKNKLHGRGPAIYRKAEIFVDPISYIIKSSDHQYAVIMRHPLGTNWVASGAEAICRYENIITPPCFLSMIIKLNLFGLVTPGRERTVPDHDGGRRK